MSTTNTISLYMKEIMRYPLLTEEQENLLAEQIQPR